MNVYDLLAQYMVPIIVILGAILGVLLLGNLISIKGHYDQINSILNWKNRKSSLSKTTHEVVESSEEAKATPDDIRELETAFNKACSWHEAFSQLIPLFPLFGILGTVAGLILRLNADEGTNAMFASLNLALKSTFVGLVFAIGLKFFDTIGPAKKINETEIILEDYNKKINNAVMLDNIAD